MTLAGHEPAVAAAARADVPARTAEGRPPPKAICILLPVWGDEYIRQFLEQSLPTLLAPGNIPALAKALPTRFVFLSRARDEATIRAQSAFDGLAAICDVGFLSIDDLITQGNHSTTVTLAYTRAVRQTGEAMLDTCFFFLVSDYIMADGSLASVLARMQAGASAVQAGNFQLDEEAAERWLLERLAGSGAALTLEPREVMRWALNCLHPLSVANLVNYPLCHNTDANRLLWRVDADTLIGRFYLLHMICIRPEIVDFVIGSSCDYSFVPEMCPSGNIETMTDSDDYLVVEIQPGEHESRFLRLGPGSIKGLVKNLSEWTTAGHRAIAQRTIVFHAAELPAALPRAISDADEFIRRLTLRLSPKPQPHRDHPYWLGAIAAFETATSKRDLGGDDPTLPLRLQIARWVQRNLFGRAPVVTRAHPRWRDFEVPLAVCETMIKSNPPALLIGASRQTALTRWLGRRVDSGKFVSLQHLRRGRLLRGIERKGFDLAFLELVDNEVMEMSDIFRLVTPLMRPGGEILVLAINANWFADPENFSRLLAAGLGSLTRGGLWQEEFRIVPISRFRWWINNAGIAAATAMYRRSAVLMPFNLFVAAILFPIMAIANIFSSWLPDRSSGARLVSSVFIRLRLDSQASVADWLGRPRLPTPDKPQAKGVRV